MLSRHKWRSVRVAQRVLDNKFSIWVRLPLTLFSIPERSRSSPGLVTPESWVRSLVLFVNSSSTNVFVSNFFVSSTRSSQAVSHPSTIQAQCCVTSEFEWELAFPTWHSSTFERDWTTLACSKLLHKIIRTKSYQTFSASLNSMLELKHSDRLLF